MIRATTPTHKFELHTDVSALTALKITYKQNGAIVLEKNLDDVTEGDSWVKYKLTTEETKEFDEYTPAEVQVKIKTNEGTVLASRPMKVIVGEIFNENDL